MQGEITQELLVASSDFNEAVACLLFCPLRVKKKGQSCTKFLIVVAKAMTQKKFCTISPLFLALRFYKVFRDAL